MSGAYELIPITSIRASESNPRKRFDPIDLEELADSIRQVGVLQPILVRPMPGEPGKYELVAGERRWRAASLADLTEIPCTIRELTDEQVLEIQVIENDQRSDVTDLERAHGYQRLIDLGQTVSSIATRTGKSESWIRDKLRLLKLPADAATALADGVISSSVAGVVARVPGEAARKRVSLLVLNGVKYNPKGPLPKSEDQEPLNYREAKQLVSQYFCRELKAAPFSQTDATLPPHKCDECPNRAGNAGPEYADTRADTCLDVECYQQKLKAHNQRAIQKAIDAGAKELPPGKGDPSEYGFYSSSHVDLDGKVDYATAERCRAAGKTWRKLLGKSRLAELQVYVSAGSSKIYYVVERSALIKLINRDWPTNKSKSSGKSSARSDWEIQRLRRKAERAVIGKLLYAKQQDLSELAWQLLSSVESFAPDDAELVREGLGLELDSGEPLAVQIVSQSHKLKWSQTRTVSALLSASIAALADAFDLRQNVLPLIGCNEEQLEKKIDEYLTAQPKGKKAKAK